MKINLRIKNFPVSFYSIVLGLTGLTIALQKIETLFKQNNYTSNTALALSISIFFIITFLYLIKSLKYWPAVKAEFNHPIKINFFPTFSISLLLFSIAFIPLQTEISKYLLSSGAVIHLALSLKIIMTWIQKQTFKIEHMNPSWFIPAVGNILIPIPGTHHQLLEISWFFFSIGLIFWLILLVIFFNRIIFHSPLTEKLLPTLFILIAPPAVGYISYVKLTGGMDNFSRILYYFALFSFLLLIVQIKSFLKNTFFLSWWAYSFPLAAITISTILFFHESEIHLFKYMAVVFLALLLSVISLLTYKTIKAISQKEICIEED